MDQFIMIYLMEMGPLSSMKIILIKNKKLKFKQSFIKPKFYKQGYTTIISFMKEQSVTKR